MLNQKIKENACHTLIITWAQKAKVLEQNRTPFSAESYQLPVVIHQSGDKLHALLGSQS